jgi:hypothetical protein
MSATLSETVSPGSTGAQMDHSASMLLLRYRASPPMAGSHRRRGGVEALLVEYR